MLLRYRDRGFGALDEWVFVKVDIWHVEDACVIPFELNICVLLVVGAHDCNGGWEFDFDGGYLLWRA